MAASLKNIGDDSSFVVREGVDRACRAALYPPRKKNLDVDMRANVVKGLGKLRNLAQKKDRSAGLKRRAGLPSTPIPPKMSPLLDEV